MMLAGATNSLGRTEEVVAIVLEDPMRIEELYDTYFQPDEWVRLRTSSSFKRIWRADPEMFQPYLAGFVKEVSKIDQPSVNWTFAQMCIDLSDRMSGHQRRSAKATLKRYLEESGDWIVQNTTIEALGNWAVEDEGLSDWLVPKLAKFAAGNRKSVAKRAQQWLLKLST